MTQKTQKNTQSKETAWKSPIGLFISDYKVEHPDCAHRQQAGRLRLWDKEIDEDNAQAFKEGRVYQKPYVYDSDH